MLNLLGKPKRLRDLSERDQLEYWSHKFENAKHFREPMDNKWKRWARMIDDEIWGNNDKIAQVNELKSVIFTILPFIILEPPVIEIRAYNIRDVEMAAIWERVATYVDRQYDQFSEFIWCVYSALLYGSGIAKLSYWDDILIERPTWGSGVTEPFGVNRAAYAVNNSITEIYPDVRAERWETQRYLIQTNFLHIDDVLDNQGYNKKAKSQVKPTYAAEKMDFSLPHVEQESEYVKVYEIHDFRNGKVMIMSDNNDKWLYNDVEPYGIVPYEHLAFMNRPKAVWGDSISQTIEGHVKAISENLQFMNDAVGKEGILKVLLKLGEWQETDIAKLNTNKDEIIPIISDNLDNALKVVDYNTAKKDFIFEQSMNSLREIIRSVTGVTQQERGVHEAGVETKFEASMLKTASDVRNQMRKRMFSRFASRSISKLLYLISREYSGARIAQMAGLDEQWGYNIQTPFDATKFEVDYGMTAANSRSERLQNLMLFKNLVGDYANPVILGKMAAEAMNFDFVSEMMVLGSIGAGGGGVPAGAGGAAAGVINSRLSPNQSQPMQDIPMGM